MRQTNLLKGRVLLEQNLGLTPDGLTPDRFVAEMPQNLGLTPVELSPNRLVAEMPRVVR